MIDTALGTERGLDSQRIATPSETRFYEQVPSTDVFYYEYFGRGVTLAHETREAVGSPENSVRVEVADRYEPGFSHAKIAATQTSRKGFVTSIFAVVLMLAVIVVTVLWKARAGVSGTGVMALLEMAEMGLLVLFGCLMVSLMMLELWKLYQLRAIGQVLPFSDRFSGG